MSSDEPHFVPNVPGSGMSRVILRAREYRPTHGFPRERWEQLAIPQLEAIAQEFKAHHKQFQDFWLDRLPRMRVFCVAEDNDNLLMWAHYAKDHSGAVLEFRVMPDIDNHLCAATQVIYAAEVPTPFSERHFLDAICGLTALQLDKLAVHYARVKSSIWSYEKEWRLYDLLDEPEDKLFSEYPIREQELSAVYLGCQMTTDNKRDIIRLRDKSFPDAKVFEATKCIGRYGLEFRLIG